MSEPIIAVENLSKCYYIGHRLAAQEGLRHALESAVRNPVGWLRQRRRQQSSSREEFWALNDVSFDIKRGDAVAIIGRNGAGKSTLLKILSRITEPSKGRVRLNGRVASLLEVGTGFHQELTGRENIYLNGAILGMSMAEIKRKFDEIVAFSEIDKFLDTPVKRYSSGMYVRLAFAVAAHLEPEILIVDEVLAVGDASFQQKCLGKMEQAARGGRTVLFVSHNMPAVQALCNRAVYLHNGRVKAVGDVGPLVQHYLGDTRSSTMSSLEGPRNLGETVKLVRFEVTPNPVESGGILRFKLSFVGLKPATFKDLSLLIYSEQRVRVALVDLRMLGLPRRIVSGETWDVEGSINAVALVEGHYDVGLAVNVGEFFENILNLSSFVVSPRTQNNGYAPYPLVYRGVVELNYSAESVRTASCQRPTSPAYV